VLRGGSWDDYGGLVRSAARGNFDPDLWFGSSGFRCVRSL